MLAVVLGLPAFSPAQGVGRSRWGTPLHVRMGATSGSRPVPLTGQTLQAALKIRCDTTGAQYAIYWSDQGGQLQETGVYAANPSALACFTPATAEWAMHPCTAVHTAGTVARV